MAYYSYSIDEKNKLVFTGELPLNEFVPEGYEPEVYVQESWPDGTPWGSREEAISWAENFLNFLNDPNATHTAGPNPENPTVEIEYFAEDTENGNSVSES